MTDTGGSGEESGETPPQDRRNRADRLGQRLEGRNDSDDDTAENDGQEDPLSESKPSGSSKASKMAQTEQTEKTDKTSEGNSGSVKDKTSVNMYVGKGLQSEVSAVFDRLNAQHKMKYNERMQKNRDFYPRLLRVGLDDLRGMEIEEFLAIDPDVE